MKKAYAIVALIVALFVAEKAQAQMSFNLSYAPETFATSYGNNTTTANYQGFFVGFSYNVDLFKSLDMSVGLQFRMNIKNEINTLIVTTKVKDSQYLLDLPVLLNYNIDLHHCTFIIPFVGSIMNYAVAGSTKTIIDNTINLAKWYEDNSTLNPFNLNVVGGLAFSYDGFKLYAGYRHGLIDQDKSNNFTTKTKGFFVGLGFEF